MTPNESVAAWQRPARRSRLGGVLKSCAGVFGALILAQYLAGYLFLWWVHRDPLQATPFTIARYGYYYGNRAEVRRRLQWSSAAGLALIGATALAALIRKPRSLHGDARFARRSEIARAGLFADHGLFLGRYGRRYLVLGGQQGAIVCAPPRADKGTAIVVPNLLSWPGSLICLDVKLENWRLTAGFRERIGQACHLFNPLDECGNTACWNPLSYVSSDPNLRINDVQRIGAILFPDVPGTDPFWIASGRSMFLGMTLYVLETPSFPATLGEVLRQGMASDAEGFGAHWKRVIGGRQSGRFPLSPQCVRAISDLMDLAPVTASSIRKTFTSRLDLFANPLLDAATSRNDFDLRDLRKRPIYINLGNNPGDLQLLRALLNLFIEQALGLQTRELPEHNPQLRYQVLAMLDEAAAPGRIPILSQAISYLPGYNVRIVLVVQAYSQLREIYGLNNADTMMKSLAVRILYAPKDFSEANEISQELGMTTVKVKSRSKPVFNLAELKAKRSHSVSISEQKRPLLLPQEVKELGRDRELILYEGLRPILCKKNRYYEDRLFRKRLFPPPDRATPARPHKPLTANERAVTDPMSPPEPIAAADSRSPNVSPCAAAGGDERQAEAGASVAHSRDPAESAPRSETYIVRDSTVADIERINSLNLEDFDVTFVAAQVPHKSEGEPLTRDELDTAIAGFMAGFNR